MNKYKLNKKHGSSKKESLTFHIYPIQFAVVNRSSDIDERGSVENDGRSFTHFLQQVTVPDVAFKCTEFCLTLAI